ncbi:MAG: hypothetical protein Q9169_006426 [Polycauliona sp. 2 TL-2023]
MRGSFSTDAISSLSSSIAFFALLSGEQSRAGSRAGNHSPSPLARGDREEEERSWGAEELVGRRYLERVEEDRDESEEREGMDGYGDEEDIEGEYREEHEPMINIMPATPSDQGNHPFTDEEDPYFLPGLFDWPSAPAPTATEQNNVDQNRGHSSMEAADEYESLREMVTEPHENTSHSPHNRQALPRPFFVEEEGGDVSVFGSEYSSSPSSPRPYSPSLLSDRGDDDRRVHLVNLGSIPEIPFTSSPIHPALRNMANPRATVRAFYYDYSLPISIHMPSPPAHTAYNPATLQWESDNEPLPDDDIEYESSSSYTPSEIVQRERSAFESEERRRSFARTLEETERVWNDESYLERLVDVRPEDGDGWRVEWERGMRQRDWEREWESEERQGGYSGDEGEGYYDEEEEGDEDEDEDGYRYGDEYTNASQGMDADEEHTEDEEHDEDKYNDYEDDKDSRENANDTKAEEENNDEENYDIDYIYTTNDNDTNTHDDNNNNSENDDNTSKEAILSLIANSKT